jgi:hypothetical protein
MAQSKLGSFVEANANVAIGFAINWTANITFLPILWHADSPKLSALYIGIVFTVISYVRQYTLRRWFDGMKFGQVAK